MHRIFATIAAFFITLPAFAEIDSYAQRQKFAAEIARKTKAGQFQALEDIASKLLKSRQRMPYGTWKLSVFYDGMRDGFQPQVQEESTWAALDKTLSAFVKKKPKSTNAGLFYALALQTKAWHLRGEGFANTVSPTNWAGFNRYSEQRRRVLDAGKSAMSSNPYWYAERIGVAIDLDEPSEKLAAIFEEGIVKQPDFLRTYSQMLRRLYPTWGGSVEEMVSFIRASTSKAATTEGLSNYARLARISDQEGFPKVFEELARDWETMKKSMAAVLSEYPDDWNSQEFVLWACRKADKAEVKHLLSMVKEPPSPGVLENNIPLFSTCKDWADGKFPGFYLHDPETGKDRYIR
jgi:hypothetical protein